MKEETTDLSRARLYVTTRKAYTGGERFGTWMDIRDYPCKSAFMEAFGKLYPQEEHPALLILDWQDIPPCLAGRQGVSPKIFRLAGYALQLDVRRNRAFHLWLEERHARIKGGKSRELIRLFELSYRGYYPQPGDFGRYYAAQMLAIPANPGFDYLRFEEQLLSRGYTRIGGYVFSRGADNLSGDL